MKVVVIGAGLMVAVAGSVLVLSAPGVGADSAADVRSASTEVQRGGQRDTLGLAKTAKKMHEVFDDFDNTTHEVTTDVAVNAGVVPMDCFEVRTTYDPDRHAGAVAELQRAVGLMTETIDKYLEPAVKGPDSDYARLSRQVEAAAHHASGHQHAALVHDALIISEAQRRRTREIDYIRRDLTAEANGQSCNPSGDLGTAIATEDAIAEKREEEAYKSVLYVDKYKPTSLHKHKPATYSITVKLTGTLASREQLTPDTSCGEEGSEQGSFTETATFSPLVILPKGILKDPGLLQVAGSVNGNWNAAGTYYLEEQCNDSRTYTCAGTVGLDDPDSAIASLLADTGGALATLAVQLPEVIEASTDSCPNSSDVEAPVPIEFEAGEVGDHAESLTFPIDGLDWRAHLDPFTISTGIEPTGQPLPPTDCSVDGDSVCTTAGSGTKLVVTVTPLDD